MAGRRRRSTACPPAPRRGGRRGTPGPPDRAPRAARGAPRGWCARHTPGRGRGSRGDAGRRGGVAQQRVADPGGAGHQRAASSSGTGARGAPHSRHRTCTRGSTRRPRPRRPGGRRHSTRTPVASPTRSPRHPLADGRSAHRPSPPQNWPSPRSSERRFRRTSMVEGCRAAPAPSSSPSTSHPGPPRCVTASPTRSSPSSAPVGSGRATRCRRPARSPPPWGCRVDPSVAAYDELARCGVRREPRRLRGGRRAGSRRRRCSRCRHPRAHNPRGAPGLPGTPDRPGPVGPAPGRPDTTLVDAAAWRRAWRAAGSVVPDNDAGAGPSHDRLRRVLAEHLRRSRGVAVTPDEILVVPGVGASLRALPAPLGLVGATVALEDPGYAEAWTAFQAEGVHVASVPVDGDGLDPAAIPAGAAAAYVTPSHQYPLGARMPVTRRVRLLGWAGATAASSSRTTTTASSATTSRRSRPCARCRAPRSTSSTSGRRPSSSHPRSGSPGSPRRGGCATGSASSWSPGGSSSTRRRG